jgi:hypothetical protein
MRNAQRPFAAVQESDLSSLPTGARNLPRNLGQRTTAAAHDYQLTANTTSFVVTANRPGVIVLSESYYPGDFQVTLEDEPVSYFRVNHAFKGIYVDRPGNYHVTFRYRPEKLSLALWMSLAGGLLGLGGLLADWRWPAFSAGPFCGASSAPACSPAAGRSMAASTPWPGPAF